MHVHALNLIVNFDETRARDAAGLGQSFEPLALLASDFDFLGRFEELQLRSVDRLADEPEREQRSIGGDRVARKGKDLRNDSSHRRDHATIADAGTIGKDSGNVNLPEVGRRLEGFRHEFQVLPRFLANAHRRRTVLHRGRLGAVGGQFADGLANGPFVVDVTPNAGGDRGHKECECGVEQELVTSHELTLPVTCQAYAH